MSCGGQHRLHCISWPIPKVKQLFIERWKANDWDWVEKDEHDDQEFLEQGEKEKEIYFKMFPENARLLIEEGLDGEDNIDD